MLILCAYIEIFDIMHSVLWFMLYIILCIIEIGPEALNIVMRLEGLNWDTEPEGPIRAVRPEGL